MVEHNGLYDTLSERAYLSCIFIENELFKETHLTEEHFYDYRHKQIFKAMKQISRDNKAIDLIMVMEELITTEVEGVYVSDVSQTVGKADNFKDYEATILEKWKLRKTVEVLNQTKDKITQDLDPSVIGETSKELAAIDENGYEDEFNLIESLAELQLEIDQEHNGLKGIDTGYTDLNFYTNGLQEEDLIIVGARPSVGKTAFCLNIASHAATKENTVAVIFSLEMGKQSLLKRMVSAEAGIDAVKMRDARRLFSDADWDKFQTANGKISRMNLHIFDRPGVNIAYIWSKVRKIRNQYPKHKVLVIIDYLQLIAGDPKLAGNRTLQIGEISRSLKLMARELKVSMVALSQLSRGVEQRQDKRPMMSDLRESGAIEQDADIIAFLYRDDYYDKDTEQKNIIEIIIAKQRNGPVGTVQLAFVKEYGKFVNLERRFAEHA